jgi:hypothetical protein
MQSRRNVDHQRLEHGLRRVQLHGLGLGRGRLGLLEEALLDRAPGVLDILNLLLVLARKVVDAGNGGVRRGGEKGVRG